MSKVKNICTNSVFNNCTINFVVKNRVIEKRKSALNLDCCLRFNSYNEEEEVNTVFYELSVLYSNHAQPSVL